MSGTLDFSGFAPAMTPGQVGVGGFVAPTVDDPLTSLSQTGNAGSGGIFGTGVSGTQLADALKQLKGGIDQQNQQSQQGQQRGVQAGSAQSGTGQGSSTGINALINMLLQRSNQYFPGQPNRQPVALGRPSGGGLLGL